MYMYSLQASCMHCLTLPRRAARSPGTGTHACTLSRRQRWLACPSSIATSPPSSSSPRPSYQDDPPSQAGPEAKAMGGPQRMPYCCCAMLRATAAGWLPVIARCEGRASQAVHSLLDDPAPQHLCSTVCLCRNRREEKTRESLAPARSQPQHPNGGDRTTMNGWRPLQIQAALCQKHNSRA